MLFRSILVDSILLTICARGGSTGVKNKNIKELNDHPLISYTINQGIKWGKAQRVVVSTDSEEIALISKQYEIGRASCRERV